MSDVRLASVVLVDRRGWLLLQERDEHPAIDPEKWGFAGGHLEEGEGHEEGVYRELEEETGVRLPPGTLSLWRTFETRSGAEMTVWVARTELTDDDIDCQEGRQIVFVDPLLALDLDLGDSPSRILPELLASDTYRDLTVHDR